MVCELYHNKAVIKKKKEGILQLFSINAHKLKTTGRTQ